MSEMDFLNGEIVRLGKALQVPTPLNERVLALVRRAELERHCLTLRDITDAFEGESALPQGQ